MSALVWGLLAGCGLLGGRSESCEEGDCARAGLLGAAEDCTDGTDNDGDGLVDCEDGDCADVCIESDCTDGVDDEGDGLTDCDDEDCWGSGSCTVVTSTVGGGSMIQTKRHIQQKTRNDISFSHQSFYSTTWSTSVALSDVWGTAQILVPGDTAWTTCDWSFTEGLIGWRRWQLAELRSDVLFDSSGGSTASAITRSGFAVDPDCPVSTSGFLPRELTLDVYALWVDGVSRYQGDINSFTHTYSNDLYYDNSPDYTEHVINSTQEWTIDALDEGGTWSYTP